MVILIIKRNIAFLIEKYVYLRMEDAIWINGNVPSSKNSKVITKSGFIVHSKQCQTYYKASKQEWLDNREIFLDMITDVDLPIKVAIKFVRQSKHKFDYVNPAQTILDLMVKYQWIEDDNADIIIPVFEPYKYSKEKPGVYIKLID
jgi:hypothetical protein